MRRMSMPTGPMSPIVKDPEPGSLAAGALTPKSRKLSMIGESPSAHASSSPGGVRKLSMIFSNERGRKMSGRWSSIKSAGKDKIRFNALNCFQYYEYKLTYKRLHTSSLISQIINARSLPNSKVYIEH